MAQIILIYLYAATCFMWAFYATRIMNLMYARMNFGQSAVIFSLNFWFCPLAIALALFRFKDDFFV